MFFWPAHRLPLFVEKCLPSFDIRRLEIEFRDPLTTFDRNVDLFVRCTEFYCCCFCCCCCCCCCCCSFGAPRYFNFDFNKEDVSFFSCFDFFFFCLYWSVGQFDSCFDCSTLSLPDFYRVITGSLLSLLGFDRDIP